MKALALVAVMMLVGCASTLPSEWGGDLPPDGRRLTNDQRVLEYNRFAVEELNSERVVLRQGEKPISYTAASYAPVLDSINPKIRVLQREAVPYVTTGSILLSLSPVAASYAAVEGIDRRRRIGAVALSAMLWIGMKFALGRGNSLYEEATTLYRDGLDRRLFPGK